MSTVPAKQIPQLHTFQGAQAQHWQNKSHGLLQQGYFCDSHLHVRWHSSRTCHPFQIPWIHSHSWWKYAHSSWEDGRQLEAIARVTDGCQVWATSSLTYDSSVTTRAHILHLGFLRNLLGVKKSTETHCVLRETGQMPISFYWFRCTIRFWNSLLSLNNPLLEKIVRADLLQTEVIHGLTRFCMRSKIYLHLNSFGWRDLDILTPHEAHHSGRIMRTYHTHFGVPLGKTPGWWDDRKRNQKPVLPLYLRLDISSNLSRALSCLRLSGHNFLVQRMRHDRNWRPYELRICDRCDWHTIQDEEHILF